ncbi:stage II sporulation protein M [Candidatus Pacearchaeota archaeon]|nr:stage II sporulation protein M [Candidatus Pacearchaeota archaeon]
MKKKKSKKIIRKKGDFIAKNYSDSWNYIKDSRNFIYSIILVFLAFFLIGFFLPVPKEIAEQILKFIEELFKQTENMSQSEITRFIFLNNLQSSITGMLFGVFLGIFPIVIAMVNGYILGFVALMSVGSEGFFVLWRLFPHGIFELPAVFISLGMGLKFGTFIFQKNKSESFRNYLWNSLKTFLFVVLPLLVIAAIIEGILIIFQG